MNETTATDEVNGNHAAADPLEDVFTIRIGEVISEAPPEDEPEDEPHISDHPTIPLVPPRREFHFNYWLLVAALLFFVLVGEHAESIFLYVSVTVFHRQAEVTLFTSQKAVHESYSFLAVTGTADPTARQIPSRLIEYTTPARTVTIAATGTAQTAPTPAYGSIALYNDAPYSQTIDVGTVITGSDGMQVVTDETVTVSAGNGAVNGSVTVPAHTLQTGTASNIPAYDINRLCCLSGIRAMNVSNFTGGHDPVTFTVVSLADITQATKKASLTLDPLAEAAVMQEQKTSEQTLTPLTCSFSTQATPAVGQRATRTTVTLRESCTMQVYDAAMLQSMTRSQFMQDVTARIGSGYTPKQEVSVQLAKPTLLDSTHHTYTLPVTVSGTIIYHPTPAQVQRLASLIAGKSIPQARSILLTNTNVEGAYIQPVDNSQTLPADPNQIKIIV